MPETLHITHVLVQEMLGLTTGQNARAQGRRWQHHFLQNGPEEEKEPWEEEGEGRVATMVRVEFQDGTRKAPTQDYHGSGRVHVHAVVCVEHPRTARLDRAASASLPEDDDDLHGYVVASQLDKKHDTPWQVHDGRSRWDPSTDATLLHHTQEDHDAGVRAFFPDGLDAKKCHMDIQECNDDGALQAYLVKYPVKYSDASSEDWLDGDHGGDALAQSVLFRYRPYEPEMVLQLFGARFRQWRCNSISGGKRDFRVPVPGDGDLPKEVRLYEESEWRGPDMSLLDFLRRSNEQGQIIHWLKRKFLDDEKQGKTEAQDVEEYARTYKMFGEKLVAADMLSWRSDRHHGQWLVLHVPFRRITELLDPEVDAKVPRPHRFLAHALRCPHPVARAFWQDEAKAAEEMKREGRQRKYIEDLLQN